MSDEEKQIFPRADEFVTFSSRGAELTRRSFPERERLDHELFTLLAGHAATSIFAAQLCGHSERKLDAIQSFVDPLTR